MGKKHGAAGGFRNQGFALRWKKRRAFGPRLFFGLVGIDQVCEVAFRGTHVGIHDGGGAALHVFFA